MKDFTIFILGFSITVAASLLVVISSKVHLKNILADLCGTQARADFWVSFSNVTLIMIPAIFAMYTYPQINNNAVSIVFEIVKVVRWPFVGLLGTFVVLGLIISKNIGNTFMPINKNQI